MIAFALALLWTTMLALSFDPLLDRLRQRRRYMPAALGAAVLLPYALAAMPGALHDPAATGWDTLIMLAYVAVPTLLLWHRPPGNRPLDLLDALAVLALWWPLEFGWLPRLGLPAGPNPLLSVTTATGVCLILMLFLAVRPLAGMGYRFRMGAAEVGVALAACGAFLALAVPLALAVGFAGWGRNDAGIGTLALMALAGYFLIALPEEILFRGVIQNLIEQRMGRTPASLVVGALIFGLAHLNNASTHHAPPNPWFAGFAFLAGLVYGWVWRRTGKVTVAALTHAGVNLAWWGALRG